MQWRKWIPLAMAAGLVFVGGCGNSEDEVSSLMEKGVRSFQAGDYAAAASEYRRVIELEPQNAAAHNLLGMACRFQFNTSGDPAMREKETEAFRRAVALNPRFLAAVKNLAATLHRDGDLNGAARMARQALEINPDDPEKDILKSWIRSVRDKEE